MDKNTPPAAGPPPPADPPEPSREQRLQLIRRYQAQALKQHDLHLANLQLLDGEVMELALGYKKLLEQALPAGEAASSGRRFERLAEGYLKAVRQVERTAQVVLRLSGRAGEE